MAENICVCRSGDGTQYPAGFSEAGAVSEAVVRRRTQSGSGYGRGMAVSQWGVHLWLRVSGAFVHDWRGLEMAARAGETGIRISGCLAYGIILLFWRACTRASFLFSGFIRLF